MSIVTVIGATGTQGGSVIRQLLKNPNWKVRGVTRNPDGEKAQSLSREARRRNGTSRRKRSSKPPSSLQRHNCHLRRDHLLGIHPLPRPRRSRRRRSPTVHQPRRGSGLGPDSASLRRQHAASCEQTLDGKSPVPHFDFKQKGVEWMRANTPELWAKTTEFWPGAYTSNLVKFPMLKFVPIPGSGHYAFVAPSSPSALFALGGDMETNCGVIVEGILNAGSNAFDKVAVCVTDYVPFRDVTVEFERVTGKAAAYLEISDKDIAKIWGPFGLEIASQLRWGEHYSDWDSFAGERAIGIEELGVSDRLVHFKEALEGLKDRLV
ncbi:hypothetical protein ACJZ2D_008403 [Fusarium nematophilum]